MPLKGAAMSLTVAASGFVVFLLSVTVIQGENYWKVTYTPTEICALKGLTVEINCTYSYPSRINNLDTTVEKIIWFTRVSDDEPVDLRTDSEYSGRVQYYCGVNDCSLRITDLRKSDSAEYKFVFITNQPGGIGGGLPGVTLSVTDPVLQVQVAKRIVHQGYSKVELKCNSHCRLPDDPSYIWYKNGQEIQAETSSVSVSFDSTDSFSCALKGHEDFPSHPVCVDGQYCHRVAYYNRSICAIKGLSVDMVCMYSSYDAITSILWFSPARSDWWQNSSQPEDLSEDSQYAGRVSVANKLGNSVLRITDLRESDSAQYHFKFKTRRFEWRSSLPGITLTVADPDLQVRMSSWNIFRALLQCQSKCHLPDGLSYTWYKNGLKIKGAAYYNFVPYGQADSFSCALEGHKDFPSPPVCVLGQSCTRVTYTDRSICAFRGSSVNISCMYNSYKEDVESKFWFSPKYNHRWQDPSQPEDLCEDFQWAGRVQVLETERGRSTLRITDLRESDSAQYHFKFKTPRFEWMSSLPGTTLTVTAVQAQVISVTVHQSYTEAELKCHSSCSPAGGLTFVWFKNGEKLLKEESSSFKDRFYPGDNTSCALKGHEDYSSPSVYALKVPSVLVSPSGEIMEGCSVTLSCSSNANKAVKYTWNKTNQTLLSKEPQLVLRSIQSSDSGEYYCTAENELGKRTSEHISVNVKYAPKTSSVSLSPSGEIVEGNSVTLTCSSDANPAAKYTWYKENQTLLQGLEGIYQFTTISSEDRGSYYCKSENKHGELGSQSVFIDVQYGPKLPSVSVSPSAEVVEGATVTLICSSDANPEAKYTWYKENEESPKASGQIYTITDFRAELSGNYYCGAQNRKGYHNSTLHLIVLAGAWRSIGGGTTTAVVLAIIFLSVFVLTRKKRAAKQSSEPRERLDCSEPSIEQEEQDDLDYASVKFYKNQADVVYSNIRPAQPYKHEKEETVVYAVVKFKRSKKWGRKINKTC